MRPDQVVSVELQGGLGNQMFEYAAGHALARRTGATLQLDLSHFARFDKRRYELDCFKVPAPIAPEPSPTRWRGLAHAMAVRACKVAGLSTRALHGGWNVYIEPSFHYDTAFDALTPPVHLHGYFQSEAFFRPVADEVRQLFTIRVPTSQAHDTAREKIAAAAWPTSIHVRRGDYIAEKNVLAVHGICDEAYYRAALALGERLCPKPPTWFVFSDDIPRARELFGDGQNFVYLCGDPARPWEDIALMAACRGHVIANSSFSWWGAWLDPHPDKWVIAPRQWFAQAHLRKVSTADIYCPGWITL